MPAVVYLDTNVFVDAIEGELAFATPAQRLLLALRDPRFVAVTSELTLAEVIVPKLRPWVKRSYFDLLVWSRRFRLVPISRSILYFAAELLRPRSMKDAKLPDRIHIATAFEERATFLITRDKRMRAPRGIAVLDTAEPATFDRLGAVT